ncbi:hypothetical protein CSUB01_10256 [Colletotrichum sublineola]|uniref:Uncharacterized protein n=1 Tax=Colletotrichum sublineola TaxID=1173701 RepID=A0A066Y1S3_COLSU|nr:hypothetical protein CSUB01_10256 [Colletotrichum sublineola]
MEFRNLPPVTDPTPQVHPSKGTKDLPAPAQDLLDALNNLVERKSEKSRTRSIRTIISMLYPEQLSFVSMTELHPHYGVHIYRDAFKGRPCHNACPVQAAWEATPACSTFVAPCEPMPTRPQGSTDALAVANVGRPLASNQRTLFYYIDLKTIAVMRHDMYKTKKCNPLVKCGVICRCNKRVRRLRKSLHRRILPLELKEDPFIAAVILALAQRPFYEDSVSPDGGSSVSQPTSSSRQEPEFHDTTIHILTVANEDTNSPCFIVYKGLVTKELLYKFHEPNKNPCATEAQTVTETTEGNRGMQIEYTEVPTWTMPGLKDRLGKALGKKIVDPIDENNIEKRQ